MGQVVRLAGGRFRRAGGGSGRRTKSGWGSFTGVGEDRVGVATAEDGKGKKEAAAAVEAELRRERTTLRWWAAGRWPAMKGGGRWTPVAGKNDAEVDAGHGEEDVWTQASRCLLGRRPIYYCRYRVPLCVCVTSTTT